MRRLFIASAVVLLGVMPASGEITATRIVKDETISVGGIAVRHVVGAVLGKAERNEPGIPTLDKVVGLKFESDFELWLPVAHGNGRFWFSVLNRGNDTGGLARWHPPPRRRVRLVRMAGQERNPAHASVEADRLCRHDAAGLRAGSRAGFRRLPPLLAGQ